LAASICAPWLEAQAKLPAKMNAKVTNHMEMDRNPNRLLVNFRIVSSSPIGVVVAERLTA
jgi:glycerol dehydrogenase-like iron-containing ADH family enzyme